MVDPTFEVRMEDLSDESDLSDSALDKQILDCQPSNTKLQTKWGLKRFTDWLARRPAINIDFAKDSEEHIAMVLRKFYLEVKTCKKTNLSPGQYTSAQTYLVLYAKKLQAMQSYCTNNQDCCAFYYIVLYCLTAKLRDFFIL